MTSARGRNTRPSWGLDPNLWIDDKDFITRMGELCDRYGMDSISLSNTLGFAFTLFELGRISEKETGGLKLDWGDVEVVEKMVHITAEKGRLWCTNG